MTSPSSQSKRRRAMVWILVGVGILVPLSLTVLNWNHLWVEYYVEYYFRKMKTVPPEARIQGIIDTEKEVADSLEKLGRPAIPHIIKFLGDINLPARRIAAKALIGYSVEIHMKNGEVYSGTVGSYTPAIEAYSFLDSDLSGLEYYRLDKITQLILLPGKRVDIEDSW